MKIAIVDHSFHRKTASSAFFIELLEERFTVSVFSDESWKSGKIDPDLVRGLLEGGFDKFIFYQVFWPAELYQNLGFEKLLFIPMYDDIRKRSDDWWGNYRRNSFVSFSRALDQKLERIEAEYLPVQFFPNPQAPKERKADGLVGFFWQRNRALPWQTILEVAGENDWKRFYFHHAPDPDFRQPRKPPQSVQERYSIEVTEWFDKAEDFHKVMSSANVHFAPRLYEGIGMGFLEAMAAGQCVVAPNTATHNEYIVHGENGLLYDPDNPSPVSLTDFQRLGEAARETCRAGHENWIRQRVEIQDFVENSEQSINLKRMKSALSSTPATSRIWNTRKPLAQRIAGRVARTLRRKN